MLEVSNVRVYDLEESVIASGLAMRTIPCEYTKSEFEKSLKRAIKLAKCGGGTGHSNFRVGVRVAFDIKYPQYFSPELQRYHFNDIVTSQSKMHKLMEMDLDMCCTKYVNQKSKDNMRECINAYKENPTYENFMVALNNTVLGIELVMRCTTNYESLATIYKQRKHHKLIEDWQEGFCKNFIETLPYAKELITIE